MAELCVVCSKKMGGFSGLMKADDVSMKICNDKNIPFEAPICINCIRNKIAFVAGEEARLVQEQKNAEEQARLARVKLYTFNPFAPDTYENLGLLTVYMSMGTGLVTEFLSQFTDLVGAESKTYNKKLSFATDICIARLVDDAIDLEADAVIGIQTTFTELTAGQGQILVCMIGTAVKKK